MKKKTIFAVSTPQGKSAIAVIRISGPNAYTLVKKISSNIPKKPNTSLPNKIFDKNKSIIDKTITTYFRGPKSFTGEDVIEINTHGGNAVLRKIIKRLLDQKDLRPATPGEFTRRAFENNKLDLTQVEAIADLVNAETESQRKQAINHLSGNFFKKIKKIFEELKTTLANIEAVIDFSDDDLPPNLMTEIKEQIENKIKQIKSMLDGSKNGISIRNGFLVTIIGKPNTGKSSFINAISDKEVAIVTKKPGTTRDLIESFVDVDGLPIRFVDTAGIRKSNNLIEKIGVSKALKTSKEANINLIFIQNKKDVSFFGDINNPIFVMSKQDLSKKPFKHGGFYNISSKNNFGINPLLKIIKERVSLDVAPEDTYISRERHVLCLNETIKHLLDTKKAKNLDLYAEDVLLATKSLARLFGNVDIEDILDIIFSDFCIGK